MILLASVERDEGHTISEVSEMVERMREVCNASSEWGIVFYGVRSDEDGQIELRVEIEDANDLHEAGTRFDAFREAVRPSSEFGITMWNLRESDISGPSHKI